MPYIKKMSDLTKIQEEIESIFDEASVELNLLIKNKIKKPGFDR